MNIPQNIIKLAQVVNQSGGTLFVVGGAVRDWVMGQEPIDFDLLMVGVSESDAMKIMNNPQKVIGNAPVFMWEGNEVALARREISTGQGKHAFEFVADETLTIKDDLIRRDFTINAMAWDILNGELIDPFNGVQDIQDKILHPVSEAFKESPERVFRGMSFAGRFDFNVSGSFIQFAKEMKSDFHSIPKEQIWRHFWKGLTKSIKPSRILEVLELTEWDEFFTELNALRFTEQDSEWHPEGNVFKHTKFVLDECDNPIVRLSAICHDLGKPDCTIIEDGRIKSPRHDQHIKPTIKFLDSIGCFEIKIREQVISLVKEHMSHINTVSRRSVRRLSQRIQPATIEMLAELVQADVSGRPALPKHMPKNMARILEIASEEDLSQKPPEVIIKGRHLIDLGMKPSKRFGVILKQCEDAQIDGEFDNLEDGLEFLKSII